jgi:hypothetical protein
LIGEQKAEVEDEAAHPSRERGEVQSGGSPRRQTNRSWRAKVARRDHQNCAHVGT